MAIEHSVLASSRSKSFNSFLRIISQMKSKNYKKFCKMPQKPYLKAPRLLRPIKNLLGKKLLRVIRRVPNDLKRPKCQSLIIQVCNSIVKYNIFGLLYHSRHYCVLKMICIFGLNYRTQLIPIVN